MSSEAVDLVIVDEYSAKPKSQLFEAEASQFESMEVQE